MSNVCRIAWIAAGLILAAPAWAQTVRDTPKGPSVGTGVPGRWFLIIRTEDGLAPEVGPFPQRSDCNNAMVSVVEDVRAEYGEAMASKARARARCERR